MTFSRLLSISQIENQDYDTDDMISLASSQATSESEFVGAVEELNETMKPLSIEGGVMSGAYLDPRTSNWATSGRRGEYDEWSQ